MQFENTAFLIAGLTACVALVWLYRWVRRTREDMLRQFASPHLVEQLTANVSPKKRKIKFVLLLLGIAGVFAALARPQAGFRWEEAHRRGIDILMAVDTSKSMLANDVQPNRLERARLGILDFMSGLDGDRVGLIPFSGTAFLMCPLTLDYDAFRQSLDALDTTLIPRVGTDIASAIREAEAAFNKDANHRILVLITDGEDLEGEALAAAKAAAKRGITIHTVGVGTPEGDLIPASALSGAGFVKDEKGRVVKSRLDEDMLREIAKVTGGAYEPLGRQAEGLEAIYQQKLSLVPKEEFAQRMRKVPLEGFGWPLLAAIILLTLEYVISDRKTARLSMRDLVTTTGWHPARKKAIVSAAGCLLIMLVPALVQASPRTAEKAYEEGEFEAATAEYKEAMEKAPEDARLQFNTGAASYKDGNFDEAAGAFESVLGDEDLALQEQAYYNLGNTRYRQGQATEFTEPNQTIKQWEQALESYKGTLALNAQDEDAQYNHDLVKKRLEELRKQQEQQNQDQENQQDRSAGSDQNEEGKDQESQADQSEEEKSDEEQNQEEQESSEGQSGEEKEEGVPDSGQGNLPDQAPEQGEEEEKGQPEPSRDGDREQPAQPRPAEQQQGSQGGIGERRHPGEMTPEEAANLLDSLKGEESEASFMPASRGTPGGEDDEPRRDW